MILSQQVAGYIEKSSWIRKMFETGAILKREHGADKVCDFSLGNPDLPPPKAVKHALFELAEIADHPMAFGYMPNAGYPDVREAFAAKLTDEQGVNVSAHEVIVTCGAAGALNCVLKAVLDPGDEVMSIAPYFVEYGFYAANHGGAFTVVKSREPDFGLDIAAIEAALTPKTRVLLLNSPNNPSGAIYSIAELTALAEMLVRVSKERDKPIYLVSDEPYRFLTYDGARVPSTLPLYPYSVVCSSFSKNLGLAGERVGYALVNPEMPGKDELIDGLILANRILGFVNAPAIGQTIAARAINETVDTGIYHKRRDLMADVLDDAGFDYAMPKGGFYFFPKAPGGDDVAFVSKLQEELILAVPGSGFGFPGYFRLTFCVDEAVIARSHDGFARAMKGR